MSSPVSSTFATSTSPFLRVLPSEIRRKIYKLLLVNPTLGTIGAVHVTKQDRTKHHLSPKILETCRQIYHEASEVFYAQTFAASCTGEFSDVITPFSLLPSCDDNWNLWFDFRVNWDALRKARFWNIYLDTYELWSIDNGEFQQFCQVICDSRPRRVTVFVKRSSIDDGDSTKARELMRPLTMLRNVGVLQFRQHKYPNMYWNRLGVPRNALEEGSIKGVYCGVGPVCQRMLKKLAEGSSPVERTFEMYHRLAKFALSFEIHLAFKLAITARKSLDRMRLPNDPILVRFHSDSTFDGALEIWAQAYCPLQIWKEKCSDPLGSHIHPIYDFLDIELEKACEDALKFKDREFKINRKSIVKYLSTKFDLVAAASKEVDKYIRDVGNMGQLIGEIDMQADGKIQDSTEAKAVHLIALIEHYAASFERQKLPDEGADFLCHKRYSPHVTRMWERELLLDRLASMVENHDYREFNSVVVQVLAEMNGRLAQIRHAGEHLFDGDEYDDWRCDVEMNFLTEEMKQKMAKQKAKQKSPKQKSPKQKMKQKTKQKRTK